MAPRPSDRPLPTFLPTVVTLAFTVTGVAVSPATARGGPSEWPSFSSHSPQCHHPDPLLSADCNDIN